MFWRFFISLIAHFEKKGISRFVDKNIIHTNTYKIFGYLEDKALYLWLIGLFNTLKGNQLWSFLYWNPVFVDCFAPGWALGEKLPKVGRCTALSPLSPSFSRLVQETVAALGTVLDPLPPISATQKDFKIELWTEALSLALCETYIQTEALPPTRVHLLRPLSVIWADGGWPPGWGPHIISTGLWKKLNELGSEGTNVSSELLIRAWPCRPHVFKMRSHKAGVTSDEI